MTGGQQHSADFQGLIERRRKFIDGLDANRGEINLDIFEDFYPDRAHFVYELLQNAEDAGATEVSFSLMPDRLVCEHDGRVFTLEDVKSITGLHDSTKAQAEDKIGKFGVGFKSVFVYTSAPSIYSGDFAFRIVKLILPEPIAAAPRAQRTRFEFPFDNPKKPKADAYAEIAAGLKELDEKTLLFLTNLQSVKWRVGAETTGAVRRLKHADFHFEVLKELGGKTAASSHFLKFDEAVHGLEKQRVTSAIGYLSQRLDGLDDHLSAIENVRAVAKRITTEEIRALLARFLIRGENANRSVGTLSGGERFRVVLARLLLADPPHQILVLDEPSNNLDIKTRGALIDSLRAYRGGLLIVSHDHSLLEQLGLDLQLELDQSGCLSIATGQC